LIPVCEPYLAGKELEYVKEAVESTWIGSKGRYITEIEERFPAYIGVGYGVLTTSGTTALHLGLKVLNSQPGNEVIIPAFTMIASAFAVCYCGLKPVFVDCDRETWNIDPALIEEKITEKTKAIMPVHIYGHSCDMDAIQSIAHKHNLYIIEDAAEAIGTEYKGKKCGNLSDISCFSFFANKMITCGEGGIVCTNSEEFYNACRYYKNLAFPVKGSRTYIHNDIAFNYRMTNIQAAVLLGQFENIDRFVELRRAHAYQYNNRLKEIDGITLPAEKSYTFNSYWMYSILVENAFPFSRDELMLKLRENNIDSRPFFVSMHRQKSLIDYGCDCSGEYPVADEISKKGLYLPSGSGLESGKIEYICDIISKLSKR